MRLVPAALVPLGIAVTNGGVAFATTVSAPLGSSLGDLIGWRWAFLAVVPLALLAPAWQAWALPHLPARGRRRAGALRLLGRGPVLLGMAAILLVFMGQFALYICLRPFLEQVTGVGVPTLPTLLRVAGLAGTALVGPALRASLPVTLVAIPVLMAAKALALALLGASTRTTAALAAFVGSRAHAPGP